MTIRGFKEEERQGNGQGFQRRERQYGPFETTIELPGEVDPEPATAAYKDGMLRLMLPKTEQARARRLHIEVN